MPCLSTRTGPAAGLTAVLMAALALVLGGCAAGAAGREDDPGAQKAEKIKQLPEDLLKAGDEAARAGELDRAASLYTQAIELKPSAELWHRLGYIYARLDKKPLAAQAYASALKLDDNHAGAHEELGLLLLEVRRREPAAAQLSRAVELDGKRWRSHNALGVLADAAGDYAAAIAHYEAALEVNPNSPMLLTNLGYSHYLSGDLARAEESYGRALALNPGYRPAVANVALLHARRRDYQKALDIMLKFGNQARAHNDVGFVALQNGDLDTAENLLNEAIRLSPSYYRKAHENLRRVQDEREKRMAQVATPSAAPASNPPTVAPSPTAPTAATAPLPATSVPDASQDAAPEYRRVRAAAADLHLGRDPNAPVVGSLNAGAHVKVLRLENDWALVSYGEEGGTEPVTVGWVRSRDLTRAAARRPAG